LAVGELACREDVGYEDVTERPWVVRGMMGRNMENGSFDKLSIILVVQESKAFFHF
jgi:hypothetical protein